jgi:signal transduction histidine kinase
VDRDIRDAIFWLHDCTAIDTVMSRESIPSPAWCAPSAVSGRAGHIVRFFDDDRVLHEEVARYLGEGVRARQPLVVIAREKNREAILARLAAQFDVRRLRRMGRLELHDVHETLAGFMVDGRPDPVRFTRTVGAILRRSRRGRDTVTVRMYGEMVDALAQEGHHEAAIRLEELWNEIAAAGPLALLCGYSVGSCGDASHRQAFERVCLQHADVIPAESYSRADEESDHREIARLQQRARALETEIDRCRALEVALREALAERAEAEAARERLLAREQAARSHAERAGRLKEEFLAVLSHELRTPLHAILGWTQILEGRSEDPAVRRGLEVIRRNTTLQVRMIDDLLDVSRIVTGKLILQTERVDLAELVRSAVDTVSPSAQAKEIELAIELEESGRTVVGDAGRLQQVIWNLLANAIKFTPPRGRVEIRLERAGSEARLSIRDTGQGITKEFLPHVFERFRQEDVSAGRLHGGLGLGLAVVRYLVEAHGGTVNAESAGTGQGATFAVSLPLAPPKPAREC